MGLFERTEWRLVLALAIGLVIGAERERRKGEGANRAAAGIRTFALVAGLGGIVEQLGGGWAFAALGLVVGAAVIVAYAVGDRTDPGLTTEVALVLDYALGAYAQREPAVAFGAAIVVTAVLALRERIHTVVRDVLTTRELLDGLIFGICAAVALPLVPNRTVDPLGVVNPFVVWRLVVLVMAVTAAGHVARRLVGPRFGLAVAGFASGFVSSSATIHAMGGTARATPDARGAATAGALASNVATFVQMGVLVSAASGALFVRVLPALAVGGGVALVLSVLAMARAARVGVESVLPADARAVRLRTALLFALVVTTVSFAATFLERALGDAGALVAGSVAALADAHASGASFASLVAAGHLPVETAALGVLLALSTNGVTKVVLAFTGGPRAYAVQVTVGVVVTVGAAWAALFVAGR